MRPAASTGRVRVHWRDDGILEAAMFGYQDEHTIGQLVSEVRRALAGCPSRTVLFHPSRIEGFSPSVRGPGIELLRLIKAEGIPRAIAVASSGGVRMMGSALAFAAGLPLEFVEDRGEAERRIAELSSAP